MIAVIPVKTYWTFVLCTTAEEVAGDGTLGARPFIRQRYRADDHATRCPGAKRSAGSHSSSNKARIRRTNQFSNQRQEFRQFRARRSPAVLSGCGDEIVDLAKVNLFR